MSIKKKLATLCNLWDEELSPGNIGEKKKEAHHS